MKHPGKTRKASLVLSTGEALDGEMIGSPLTASGEIIFSTAMVGYGEALTDPSYYGQILVFSYPLIGNYGVPDHSDLESSGVHVSGVIVSQASATAHHWSSRLTLDQWLREAKVPGISGIDTRHLIHLIHQTKLTGRIVPVTPEGERKRLDPLTENVLPEVSVPDRRRIGKGKRRIALIDCGVKWNMIRKLLENGCEVELLPWSTDPAEVDCDAWLISNGPGDPMNAGDLVQRISGLFHDSRPVLGICLGNQLLALAAGAKTEKMSYGNRGHNQPVQEIGTNRGYMTSQNHGYVISNNSLPAEWEPWFVNINDHSIEGIRHRSSPFRGVQFHPEAAGGPRDTGWILEDFARGKLR